MLKATEKICNPYSPSFLVIRGKFGPVYSNYRDSAACNPLNVELNPMCHLLTLLGAHHIIHVSRTRVETCCLPEHKTKDIYLRF